MISIEDKIVAKVKKAKRGSLFFVEAATMIVVKEAATMLHGSTTDATMIVV